ncbi:mucin-5AC-like isoform X1 [Sycon ciliatum]|uniref:mucin-5AC-like isoform X1 n=1 Tax=Sycon ciliatum TaxID=27933 RepID=UPI0031F681A1
MDGYRGRPSRRLPPKSYQEEVVVSDDDIRADPYDFQDEDQEHAQLQRAMDISRKTYSDSQNDDEESQLQQALEMSKRDTIVNAAESRLPHNSSTLSTGWMGKSPTGADAPQAKVPAAKVLRRQKLQRSAAALSSTSGNCRQDTARNHKPPVLGVVSPVVAAAAVPGIVPTLSVSDDDDDEQEEVARAEVSRGESTAHSSSSSPIGDFRSQVAAHSGAYQLPRKVALVRGRTPLKRPASGLPATSPATLEADSDELTPRILPDSDDGTDSTVSGQLTPHVSSPLQQRDLSPFEPDNSDSMVRPPVKTLALSTENLTTSISPPRLPVNSASSSSVPGKSQRQRKKTSRNTTGQSTGRNGGEGTTQCFVKCIPRHLYTQPAECAEKQPTWLLNYIPKIETKHSTEEPPKAGGDVFRYQYGVVPSSVPTCIAASVLRGRLFCPEPGPEVCDDVCRQLAMCPERLDADLRRRRRHLTTQLLIRLHEWQRCYVQSVQPLLNDFAPVADPPGFVAPSTGKAAVPLPLPSSKSSPKSPKVSPYTFKQDSSRKLGTEASREAWSQVLPSSGAVPSGPSKSRSTTTSSSSQSQKHISFSPSNASLSTNRRVLSKKPNKNQASNDTGSIKKFMTEEATTSAPTLATTSAPALKRNHSPEVRPLGSSDEDEVIGLYRPAAKRKSFSTANVHARAPEHGHRSNAASPTAHHDTALSRHSTTPGTTPVTTPVSKRKQAASSSSPAPAKRHRPSSPMSRADAATIARLAAGGSSPGVNCPSRRQCTTPKLQMTAGLSSQYEGLFDDETGQESPDVGETLAEEDLTEAESIEYPPSTKTVISQDVECPMCHGQFPKSEVEAHASECNGIDPRQKPKRSVSSFRRRLDSDDDDFAGNGKNYSQFGAAHDSSSPGQNRRKFYSRRLTDDG